MNKVKVKIFPSDSSSRLTIHAGEIEEEMQAFIDSNDIEIVDMRVSANEYRLFIVLLYKEVN
ncbi:MAG: hypothetical protein PHG60_02315 [Candidatus Dojkabacteria bacterium]|jgi:hypothetical protein|nr:hypothetical protein [Candidatus Dojkabacteria bacterium]MDD2270389.1 hypothetical protein [Candidatus Dojkabacteria bacterium]